MGGFGIGLEIVLRTTYLSWWREMLDLTPFSSDSVPVKIGTAWLFYWNFSF